MQQKIDLNELIVNNKNQFNQLLFYIHDEVIKISEIEYNKNEKSIKLKIYRKHHGIINRKIKNYFFYREYEVPVITSFLKIKNVKNYNVIDTEKIENYQINSIELNYKNELIFYCEPCLKIIINISELELYFNDFEINGTAKIKYFLFIEYTNLKDL